jgi:demethylmenaquinone methyltransferase/2-methoxy-6-polyprenyl-1,4-benzoquinol methylase
VVGDLAVGTADIAIATCERYPGVSVVGVDLSPGMMRVARRKISARGLQGMIQLRQGDLRELPLGDSTLDAITLCFGIRNILDRRAVLAECCRVLKPGGSVRIMEMVMPEAAVVRALYGWYFDNVMPLAGNLMSRTDYAYSYLRHSILEFPTDAEFLGLMREAGFERAGASPISWGMAKIYDARKPRSRGAPWK